MKKLSLLLFLFIATFGFGQNYTISGSIADEGSGETLLDGSVRVKELSNVGARTNAYGFYSLSLPKGEYTLIYRASGFDVQEKVITLDKDIALNIDLVMSKDVQEVAEVKVTAVKENENITSSEMNVTRLTPKDIELIPVLFGEKDVMKTLQLTPGVSSAGEGSAGFFVRGGGADQNLILLDEAVVYNASHLLGFFSVFNSDAIKDVSLYKTGIPARFGGRASSVMDVKMKEGNNRRFGVSGGLGLISSRLAVEGPIVKNKGSFILSGRRSYLDLFAKLSKKKTIKETKLYFYDINLKANYRLSDKDRIFISGYFGRDVFGFGKNSSYDWGNSAATIRYNRIISNKLFSNTSFIYSNFNYKISEKSGTSSFGVNSSIEDWNLKQNFSYYPNKNNTLKLGINVMHHTFKPGSLQSTGTEAVTLKLKNRYGVEFGAYVQNDQKIGSRLNLMYGLRYSGFALVGGTSYEFDNDGKKLSERDYKRWEQVKLHQGIEPRLSMSFILTEHNSIKLGYNRNFQYMHQLSNSTTSTPLDVWVPVSNNIKPQIADQIALGYYQNLYKNIFRISTEIYYKNLQNQIDYRNGADLIFNNEIEGELVYGKGRAYGLELQIEKKKGKITGWISYTLSRSLRQFDQINEGKEFSARQDRTHDLSVVLMYKINKKIALSSTFIFYTGNAVTFPAGKYEIDGQTYPYYTERNGHRMPDYHRLDLGATFYFKERKHFDHNLNFSIYNAYARQNAYRIEFRKNEDTGNPEAVQISLFRIIPSLTYNFKIK